MELLNVADPAREGELRLLIEAQEAYMETELQRTMYSVSPSAIENYVHVLAPAMTIRAYNLLQYTSDGVNALEYIRDRWLRGAITTDQLIHELDARMLMLEMAQE